MVRTGGETVKSGWPLSLLVSRPHTRPCPPYVGSMPLLHSIAPRAFNCPPYIQYDPQYYHLLRIISPLTFSIWTRSVFPSLMNPSLKRERFNKEGKTLRETSQIDLVFLRNQEKIHHGEEGKGISDVWFSGKRMLRFSGKRVFRFSALHPVYGSRHTLRSLFRFLSLSPCLFLSLFHFSLVE